MPSRKWIAATLAASLAGAPVQALACGPGLPETPTDFTDRSWIDSDARLFAYKEELDLFQLPLNDSTKAPAGLYANHTDAEFVLSPQRKWLAYSFQNDTGGNIYGIYDIGTYENHVLEIHPTGYTPFVFDEGERRMAWGSPTGTDRSISVLDLSTFDFVTYLLPASLNDSPLTGFTWSHGQNDILFNPSREAGFLSLDAATGEIREINGHTEHSAYGFTTLFAADGNEMGESCQISYWSEPKESFETTSGTVRWSEDAILLEASGQSPHVIAQLPPAPVAAEGEEIFVTCSSPSLHLLDVIDYNYVLYVQNYVYWVYGIREDRNAILGDSPSILLFY